MQEEDEDEDEEEEEKEKEEEDFLRGGIGGDREGGGEIDRQTDRQI